MAKSAYVCSRCWEAVTQWHSGWAHRTNYKMPRPHKAVPMLRSQMEQEMAEIIDHAINPRGTTTDPARDD